VRADSRGDLPFGADEFQVDMDPDRLTREVGERIVESERGADRGNARVPDHERGIVNSLVDVELDQVCTGGNGSRKPF
jgi:hypothetical protein